MPIKQREQFADAVTPALESLLTDLQKTTEVLRRKNFEQHHPGASSVGGKRRGDGDGDAFNATYFQGEQQQTPGAKRFDDAATKMYSTAPQQQQSFGSGGGGGGVAHQQPLSSSQPAAVQYDPDKHGIHTIPKGDCAGCEKAIIGPVVIALGKMWHPEHFQCSQCGAEIGQRQFFERAGRAYCERDYHDLFSPRCHYCNGAISERYVNAAGKTYHPEHFCCGQCGKPLEEGFFERDGTHYCREDYYRIYAPKCQGCKQPITGKFVTALDTHWHQECFSCQGCRRPFDAAPFFNFQGAALCDRCFHQRAGLLCAFCDQSISGRCISALGRKYHPEHFCCAYCSRQIVRGVFKEVAGRPFCQRCFEQRIQ